jgi:hypothetical protein
MAERELSAFVQAVTQIFGSRQAELSANDWLRELTAREALPASTREYRMLTLRVLKRLAARLNPLSVSNELIAA